MLVLVLESSTSSAKAMLYDSEKGILDIQTEAYLPQYNDVETQDAEGVMMQTMHLGKKIAEGKKIDIIALCGTWHSVMLLDKDMNPKTRIYSWAYTGAAKVEEHLREDEEFVKEFYSTTGCMVNTIYPTFKLVQLSQMGYKLKEYLIAGQGSYNFYKLTGRREVTDSMVSGSGLLNIHEKVYDRDVLDFVSIREEQLGKITTYQDTAPLSEEGAKLLGLKSGIPVIPTFPDGALNQVGAGALGNGVMTFSVGTSAAMRLSTARPILPEEPSTWCYLSPVSWLSGAATSGACNCIDWIKDKLFDKNISYGQIEAAKGDLKDIPVFMPFLYGERCPGWHGERKAAFFDVKPQHNNVDLYFSVMEGVIFNLYHCFETLSQLNGMPKKIKLSGGILNSRFWTQMCCDIFGQEMEISTLEQTSVLGGAVLGLHLLGIVDDMTTYSLDKGEIIRPNLDKKDFYAEKLERYKYWYNKSI